MQRALRPYLTTGTVIAAAGLIVAPMLPGLPGPSVHRPQHHAVHLTAGPDEIAYIMGGSGHPIPPQDYLAGVNTEYIQAHYPGYTSEPLFYPAGASGGYTPPESLPFDTSAAQGLTILNDTIMRNINEGNKMVIFGHSQSSTISSMEMTNLAAGNTGGLGPAPTADQLHFIMTGNPSNPDGGYLSRFPGLQLTAEGTTSGAVTPPDTIYHTDVYTMEYDGVGDYPRYTLNYLADLNAVMGMQYLHPYANYINPDNVANAFLLPGSADLTGAGVTNYWMMPTDELPLLIPLRNVPVIGNPLADLLQPDLRVLVNLGYGSITDGWDQGPANVETPIGLLPDVDPQSVMQALFAGAQQGASAFEQDLSNSNLSDAISQLTSKLPTNHIVPVTDLTPMQALTDIVHTFTGAVTTASSYLLPMSSIIDDSLTSLPIYALNLGVQGLQAGNVEDALGMPLAGIMGQVPILMAGFSGDIQAIEFTLNGAFDHIAGDLSSLF